MTDSPFRWVIATEVAQLLDDDMRQRIDESARQYRLPCQVCNGEMDARVEEVSVIVLWADDPGTDVESPRRAGKVRTVAFAHAGCAPSQAIHDPELVRMVHSTEPQLESVARLGALNGWPLMLFDARVTTHVNLGGGLTDAASTGYLQRGFTLVTAPLEQLRPQDVALARGWVLEMAGGEFRLRRADDPSDVAYVQDLNPEVARWVEFAHPGPVLVVTGTGLSPTDPADEWEPSIDAARLAGRLVAAWVPLAVSGRRSRR